MEKIIVMLSGKAGVGKDTFASLLGSAWERVSFADALKKEASKVSGLPINYFHDRGLKDSVTDLLEDGQTPRDFLLTLAKERKSENLLYWADQAVRHIEESANKYFVITDWRFPHELEAMHTAFLPDLDGYRAECELLQEERLFMDAEELARDLRTNPKRPEACSEIRTVRIVGDSCLRSSDESECALDGFGFDSFIVNRSSMEVLKEKARLLGAIMGEDEAMESVYKELRPKAKRLCRKHTYNVSDLDDVTVDAMHNVFKQLSQKFNFTCSLWTFAYKVIYYSTQNYRRRINTYTKRITLNSTGVEDSAVSMSPTSPLLGERIDEAVNALPPRHIEFFRLRHEGWSHKELGERFGITTVASRRRLNYINKGLRSKLRELYDGLL